MNISTLLDPKNVFCVIGASNNEEKYGYKIYKQLKEKGYTVFPVNPREELIQGDRCYDNLFSLPQKGDVLSFVVPPDISLKVTMTAFELGYKVFWYQPGSYNKEILEFHQDKATTVISDQCLLIATM